MRKPCWRARSASSARSAAARAGSSIASSDTFEQRQSSRAPSSCIRSNLRAALSKLRARAASGMDSKSRIGCSATISSPRSAAICRASRGFPLKKVRSFSKISTALKPALAAAASLASSAPPMQTVAIDHRSIHALFRWSALLHVGKASRKRCQESLTQACRHATREIVLSILGDAQLIEDMVPDLVDALQRVGPIRHHVIGVIVQRGADFLIVDFAVCHILRDPHRNAPGTRLFDAQRLSFAGEGELAGEGAIAVLIDDAANIRRIKPAAYAIEHDLRDCRLTVFRLATGFEIDRLGKAALLARRIFGVDQRGVVGLTVRQAFGDFTDARDFRLGDDDRLRSEE